MARRAKIPVWLAVLRPIQWIKSGFCLAALFFGGLFLSLGSWLLIFPLLVAMSILSSAGYIWNDLLNREEDRKHPRKKFRPIASGQLQVSSAVIYSVALASTGLLILFFAYEGGITFFLGGAYLLLTLSYSLWIRSLFLLDVMVLSLGFVIRVVAGSSALNLPSTWWLVACTYTLALLLGLGKRKGELKMLEERGRGVGATRHSLENYSAAMLDTMLVLTAVISLALYAFYAHYRENLWIWVSVLAVAFGLADYLRVSLRSSKVETPEKLFFENFMLFLSVLIWLGCILLARI